MSAPAAASADSTHQRPNAPAVIQRLHADGRISPRAVGLMLIARTLGFALFQALVAIGYASTGADAPWARSVAWWPYTATATSVLTLAALILLLRREGLRYRDLLHVEAGTWRRDAMLAAGLAVLAVVFAIGPNLGLALLLFGDVQAPLGLFLQPLPRWAAAGALVIFPLTVAASELPVYAGYVQPRLEALTGRAVVAIGLAAGGLAIQHAALPLIFEWRFLLWRALMFVPFAVLFIVVLRWRPRLLPYLVVVHLLADLGAAVQVWTAR